MLRAVRIRREAFRISRSRKGGMSHGEILGGASVTVPMHAGNSPSVNPKGKASGL